MNVNIHHYKIQSIAGDCAKASIYLAHQIQTPEYEKTVA